VNGLIRSQSQTGLTPSYHGRVIFLDIGSRAPEDIPEKTQRIALAFSGGVRARLRAFVICLALAAIP
jgi:hypothetical protein